MMTSATSTPSSAFGIGFWSTIPSTYSRYGFSSGSERYCSSVMRAPWNFETFAGRRRGAECVDGG
jgi:hypothetical protein